MFVIYAFSNKPMKYYMKFPQAEGFFGEEKIPHGLLFRQGMSVSHGLKQPLRL